ncbi:MAG: hypothetical protein GY868_08295, partial [Deltaproteobacteria bacterium]|nr:hypothetical protein [Deltaproteobacteria bacterium]
MTTTYGWTGSLLRIDLSTGQNSTASSRDYTEHFIGGRMLGARLYWDEVSPNTRALDADNVLMILPGPLAGTQATACSRWVMAAKSPYLYPDQYSFANSGGFFGAAVKQAGFDAVLINGKAAKPSYILLEDSKISFHDASGLLGLATDETIARLQEQHGKGARVVCTGPAGEKMVSFALAMADQGGALGNGMGAVMGSKNLKAIVIKAGGKIKAADPDSLKQLNKDIRTARKSQHESIYMTDPMIQGIENLKPAPCYGCPAGCARAIFKHTSGREEIRKTCAAAFLYSGWDTKYHGEATEYPFLATSLCDKLGLCTQEISNILYWFSACREQDALSEDKTGLDLSQLGSQEFFEKLIDMIVTRTGFGDLLALGIRRAGIELGGGADELARARVTPSGYVNDAYSARLYLPNGIAYATE